jgi:hypothetical protein
LRRTILISGLAITLLCGASVMAISWLTSVPRSAPARDLLAAVAPPLQARRDVGPLQAALARPVREKRERGGLGPG